MWKDGGILKTAWRVFEDLHTEVWLVIKADVWNPASQFLCADVWEFSIFVPLSHSRCPADGVDQKSGGHKWAR